MPGDPTSQETGDSEAPAPPSPSAEPRVSQKVFDDLLAQYEGALRDYGVCERQRNEAWAERDALRAERDGLLHDVDLLDRYRHSPSAWVRRAPTDGDIIELAGYVRILENVVMGITSIGVDKSLWERHQRLEALVSEIEETCEGWPYAKLSQDIRAAINRWRETMT